MKLKFEWNSKKAILNMKTHAVSFEEAKTVFYDPLALIFYDEVHSRYEIREIIIGYSVKNRLLLVYFTERKNAIRIFSARKATKKERKDYEENRRF